MELIDSRHLRLFEAVVRHGNMRRAARELSLTPSAVSHALRALEGTVGCELLRRTTRRVEPTAAGERFLPEARRLLEVLEGLPALARGGGDWRRSKLRIGASPTACQYLLPAVLREFKESCPDVALTVTQGSATELAKAVAEGGLDLGLSPLTPQHRDLECEAVAADRLAFIVNPLHRWARAGKVARAEIGAERFVLAESRSFTKGLIDDYLRRENLTIRPFIEIGNEEVIKELVRLDIGVGIFPEWIAAEEVDRGLLVSLPMGRRAPTREWVVCRRSSAEGGLAETLFRGICRLVAANRIGRG